MVSEDTVLDTFPDSPVTTAALSELENHDDILTAIPLISEARGAKELSKHAVIQTDSVVIVVVYNDGEGWTVDHRVDGTDRDNDAVFEEAMVAAQGETSLVDAPNEK